MIEDQPRLGLPPTMSNVGEQYPAVRAIVEQRLAAAAAELAARRFVGQEVAGGAAQITIRSISIADVALPWQRLFDLTLDVVLDYGER
jgi:hypothetical protein